MEGDCECFMSGWSESLKQRLVQGKGLTHADSLRKRGLPVKVTVNKYRVLREVHARGFWKNMVGAEGKRNVVGNEIREAMRSPWRTTSMTKGLWLMS